MRTFLEGICWIAAALLQWQLDNHLSIYGLSPDLLFTASIAFASFSSETRGALWAFFAGLYADMYYGSPLGASALAYTLSAWAAQIAAQRFDLFDRLTQTAAVFLFSWPACLMCQVLFLLFSSGTMLSLKYLCAIPFLNALSAPFVFAAVLGLKRVFRMEDRY